MAMATKHVATVLPKMSAMGDFSHFRLTGGHQYREWLVTLPWYPSRYTSPHFEHENILLHFRCDVRETANGCRVLLLQEAQSDWAQEARRQERLASDALYVVPVPPWVGEWPSLALKLLLLHSATNGYAALAWTTGAMQEERYGGSGAAGLRLLYDRTMPEEASRMMRPFHGQYQPIDLFQPMNYRIEPDDTGYAVLDCNQALIARAETWDEALQKVPDGAREDLVEFHSVPLDSAIREAILAQGFSAWGHALI
jgi:hypothetical protein